MAEWWLAFIAQMTILFSGCGCCGNRSVPVIIPIAESPILIAQEVPDHDLPSSELWGRYARRPFNSPRGVRVHPEAIPAIPVGW